MKKIANYIAGFLFVIYIFSSCSVTKIDTSTNASTNSSQNSEQNLDSKERQVLEKFKSLMPLEDGTKTKIVGTELFYTVWVYTISENPLDDSGTQMGFTHGRYLVNVKTNEVYTQALNLNDKMQFIGKNDELINNSSELNNYVKRICKLNNPSFEFESDYDEQIKYYVIGIYNDDSGQNDMYLMNENTILEKDGNDYIMMNV